MMTLFQFSGFCFMVTVAVPEGRSDPVAVGSRLVYNHNAKRFHIYYYYGIRHPKPYVKDGLLGPNSILVMYMDPAGHIIQIPCLLQTAPQICSASRAIL